MRGLMQSYNAEIHELIDKSYAVPVFLEQIQKSDNVVWYLSQYAIISQKKLGKVCIAFNRAARYLGESLNDKCFKGPDINNELLPVMLRFRQYPYAVTSDIVARYYQFPIPKYDQNALSFLWFQEDGEVDHFKMTRHVFGGVWCVIANTSLYPLVVDTIRNSFHVDDCLSSLASIEDAVMTLEGVKADSVSLNVLLMILKSGMR
ncbi:uncharacterized protein [Macrobrachium rosenbergii]|uniref:uncharacterized protein n=1 Tax=Macrobrachium rosenbergii TaxID=79674 RepID=UPI0034D4207B